MNWEIVSCSDDMVWLDSPYGAVLQVQRTQYDNVRNLLGLPELVCPA